MRFPSPVLHTSSSSNLTHPFSPLPLSFSPHAGRDQEHRRADEEGGERDGLLHGQAERQAGRHEGRAQRRVGQYRKEEEL